MVNPPSLKFGGGICRGIPGPSMTRNCWAHPADARIINSPTPTSREFFTNTEIAL
jgi:hypothetical protein